jgi:geranylgeranyl diphosphate synthase, type II
MRQVSSEFSELISQRKALFGRYFVNQIYPLIQKNTHKRLASAMLYSLEAGGKKFRPILTISSFLANGNESEPSKDALLLGAACELIHTYSLIHDDLPSMDNDDLRRGIPTCHVKFGESTAILAGDGLNALGFFLVSRVLPREDDMSLLPDLFEILHNGAGILGMVGGQSEDLELDGRFGAPPESATNNPEETLSRIHSRKTGALINSALLLGNRLRRDHKSREDVIQNYGSKLGLLFQLTDDILDVEGVQSDIGKTPGKDADKGKLTYVTLYGMEESKRQVQTLIEELESLAESIESPNEIFFKSLPTYLGSRKN